MMLAVRVRREREHAASCSTPAPAVRVTTGTPDAAGTLVACRRRPSASGPSISISRRSWSMRCAPCSTRPRRSRPRPGATTPLRNRYVVAHGALRIDPRRRPRRRARRGRDRPHAVCAAAIPPTASRVVAGSRRIDVQPVALRVVRGGRGRGRHARRRRHRGGATRAAGSTRSRRGCSRREEHADWLDVPAHAQLRAFLERWTAKEAYLKAIGAGIYVPAARRARRTRGLDGHGFATPPDTVARVAVEGEAVVTVQVEAWDAARRGAPARPSRHRPIDKFRATAVGSVFAAGTARPARRARAGEGREGRDRAGLLRCAAVHRSRSCCASTPSTPKTRS